MGRNRWGREKERGKETGRERDTKQQSKDKTIVLKGKGGEVGIFLLLFFVLKLERLKAKAFFYFLTKPSSYQMCSQSQIV